MAENTSRYSRRSPVDRNLRAADSDRQAIGDILRREHVAGRLDSDEYADRYGRCLEARTYAQLDELIVDLPGEKEPALEVGRQSAGPAWRPGYGRPRRHVPVFAWIALVVALIALSGGQLVWLAFPLLFFFFILRPIMWRSSWRSGGRGPGWGGGCAWGPGARRSGYPTV
jgi:Domain of unknown function (DUF1707)